MWPSLQGCGEDYTRHLGYRKLSVNHSLLESLFSDCLWSLAPVQALELLSEETDENPWTWWHCHCTRGQKIMNSPLNQCVITYWLENDKSYGKTHIQ